MLLVFCVFGTGFFRAMLSSKQSSFLPLINSSSTWLLAALFRAPPVKNNLSRQENGPRCCCHPRTSRTKSQNSSTATTSSTHCDEIGRTSCRERGCQKV